MSKIFYDTEFLEDGSTVDLISIGMVTEDGREYYAVNDECGFDRRVWWKRWFNRRGSLENRIRRHKWLMGNVIPTLPKPSGDWNLHMPKRWLFDYNNPAVKRRDQIAREVVEFIQPQDGNAETWAYYGAYDHVVLCQLFGTMMDLPDGMPMFTHELMQLWELAGKPEKPPQYAGAHNAMVDARWNLELYRTCAAVLEKR